MNCKGCHRTMRNPRGKTRLTQKCAGCRNEQGKRLGEKGRLEYVTDEVNG